MNESRRSRKWRFNVGLASDGGLGYRIREHLVVAEGVPAPVVLNMPVNVYRVAEAEHAASLGMERMIISLDVPVEVLPVRRRTSGAGGPPQ
jgi:hypothetical protein